MENDETTPNPLKKRIGRRGLLSVVAGGATALWLQACGRTPTPTPPTATAPPTGTATGTPGASIVPPTGTTTATQEAIVNLPIVGGGEPSATPTTTPTLTTTPDPTEIPTPSNTPRPTSTPVPPATPFPPGTATKLGLFIGYQHEVVLDMLRTGNVPFIKTLEYDPNLMEFIKQISPNTIIVARYSELGQINLQTVDPIAEARRFVDTLLPLATEPKRLANIDAWESYNEPVPADRDEMRRLSDFEAERTRLLAAYGIRSCIGNFATGTPQLDLWPDFYPALQAAKDHGGYLGLHEYSAPYMWFGTGRYQLEEGVDEGDTGWLTLRYRKVYRQYLQPNQLDIPLLITETGIDGQVQNRPGPVGLGWADFQDFWKAEGQVRTSGAGYYVEQLAWYDAELQLDSYVKGASIFALAAPIGWSSFELLGSCADILKQYISVHPRR